jgi:hypothetical protein
MTLFSCVEPNVNMKPKPMPFCWQIPSKLPALTVMVCRSSRAVNGEDVKGVKMKKLRNLEKLEPDRRAALEAMLSLPEGAITPKIVQPVLEANPDDLGTIIEEGVLALTLGELLEQARFERGVGVRELAKRLNLHHARVVQLEDAGRGRPENMEVQSLARQAKALAYRVRIVLEPEEGGRSLEARLG